MRDGESIDFETILAEGLRLDEREFHPVPPGGQLQEQEWPPDEPRGLAGSCLEGFGSTRLVERRPERRGVGALGLVVEDDRGHASVDQLAGDARDFADYARGALREGITDERFVSELRGLLAEAEPVAREHRTAVFEGAVNGRGGQRRRRRAPKRGEILRLIGPITNEAR
jgi:hypothetical protein